MMVRVCRSYNACYSCSSLIVNYAKRLIVWLLFRREVVTCKQIAYCCVCFVEILVITDVKNGGKLYCQGSSMLISAILLRLTVKWMTAVRL